MAILVSVIIPCFNVENYIEECVLSVLNQTYTNIEIICIDNNSSDKTFEILLDLKSRFPEIIIDKELQSGACSARNKGLEIAQGEWIQFLDADDLLLSEKIFNQIDLVKTSDSEIDFIVGAWIKRSNDGFDQIIKVVEVDRIVAPFINQCGNTCSNLWLKKTVLLVKGWSENLKSSQETDLMFRIVLNGGKYLIDNNPQTIIRTREFGQISQQDPSKKWELFIKLRLDFLKKIKVDYRNSYEKNKSVLYDFLMVSVLTLYNHEPKKANDIYRKEIKLNWETSQSYGFTRFKFFLIKLFGLKIYKILAK